MFRVAVGGLALLKEVYHWMWPLRFQMLNPDPVSFILFLLLADSDVELSAPAAPCLPVHCRATHHDDVGLNLWSNKQAPVKYFLL